MKKIKDFICCKLPSESFYKYEYITMFLSLFCMMFYYVLIFVFREKEIFPDFTWQLYPFFIILYVPLIHSLIYHIKNKDFKIKPLEIFFIFYLFFCVNATIFADNKVNSLFGENARNEGLFTIIMYILIYLLGRNIVNKENVFKLINMLFAFGIVNVIVGLFQSFTTWHAYFDEMAYGFASNPNMFGLLIGMLATIAVCLYLSNIESIKKYKKYYLFCSIFFYIGLLLAESAGPFFTFVGMLFIISIYYLIKKVSLKKIVILFIIFIILFPIIQFSNRAVNEYYLKDVEQTIGSNNDYAKLYSDVKRIINIILPKKDNENELNYEIEKNTISENASNETNKSEIKNDEKNTLTNGRLAEWREVIFKILMNHENGVGLDCLNMYIYQRGFLEILDKAHNQYLDICVSIGILGCFIYLSIMFIIFIKGLTNKNPIAKVLFFGFLYYSIAIFVNISVPFSAMYYYIVIGLLIGICEKE